MTQLSTGYKIIQTWKFEPAVGDGGHKIQGDTDIQSQCERFAEVDYFLLRVT